MVTYGVRENRRARRVLLKIDSHAGLVVVVPPGYDRRLIAPLLQKNADWIRASLAGCSPVGISDEFPSLVQLRALGEELRVTYRQGDDGSLSVRESAGVIEVVGAVHDGYACRQALRRWLRRRARRDLVPWLAELAAATGLPHSTCSIRLQRSRWGSCSVKGRISLNASLLFLPAPLVRYVLLHELSHTRHLDHSSSFWALLAKHEPLYRERRRQLASERRAVPSWVHEPRPQTELRSVAL